MSDFLMKSSPDNKKPRVQSAARTVDILQVVARADSKGISAKEISVELGLPRQVVYHLIHTLVHCDMLRKTGGNNYVLGLGVASLTHSFQRQMKTADTLGVYAEQAAVATGETAYVVGWVDDDIVVLSSASGRAMIQAAEVPPGTAGDAHARASGKLLLAMATSTELEAYLGSHSLTPRTPNTITSRAQLDAELARVREQRYSVERDEYAIGLSCMAVPIGSTPSRLALGISAPSERFGMMFDSNLRTLHKLARTRS